MHGLSKQTLCHPANFGLGWRNTGNGGLCWNPEPTLEPGEVTFVPHGGALRVLIRLSGNAFGNRPRVMKSTRAGPSMSMRAWGRLKPCKNAVRIQSRFRV